MRLPKEFRFAGDEVFIKRVGSTVVLLQGEAMRFATHEEIRVGVNGTERAGHDYYPGPNLRFARGLSENGLRARLAPRGGFEPPTNGLTVRRSTTELPGNG